MKNTITKRLISVACIFTTATAMLVPDVLAYDNITKNDYDKYSVTATQEQSTQQPTQITSTQLIQEQPTEKSSDISINRANKYFVTVPMNSSISQIKVEMGLGETYKFLPSDYSKDKTYYWSSSNQNIASVDSLGQVTAKKVGSVSIICKSSNGDATICSISVGNEPKSVSLNESYLILGVGEEYQFSGHINSGSSAYWKYFCSSSSIGLPVNSSTGIATALKPGRYSIAYFTYNNVMAKCTVVVKKAPESVSFAKSSVDINLGKSYTLNPVFSTGSYSNKISVSSSDENIATASISSDNKVIVNAKKEGTTNITLTTHNGKTATCKVTVKKENVTLSISSTANSILKGNHAYIKADVSPSTTQVSYSSSNTSVAKVDEYGIVTGVSSGNATITVTAGSVNKTYNISVSSTSSDTYLPYSQYTLNNGKTVYLKSIGSSFSSSDTSVATVNSKGFVTAKKQGVAIITANYGGSKKTCAIRVVGSDPIRFSYSSPNSASKNEKVTLIAITDTARTSVKFDVKVGNTTKTVTASTKSLDSSGKRYIWKGYYTFSSAGEYSVTAYSMYENNGKYSTCSAGKSTVFVSDVSSATAVSNSKRRPSEEILALNASYEGYSGSVYDDPLVSDTPTVGYGHVVVNGEAFYNDMSQEEAFAFMVSSMNDSSYSSAVNNFMSNYGIKFNQQQFDALVMFVYNLGTGVLYNSDINSILTNCWYNGERNMDYVNKTNLKSELIQWHHAGGSCVWGLLYRRIDELEVFCYGDYIRDGNSNKYGMTYRWNCY